MGDSCNIKAQHIRITEYRLHLVDMFLHFAHAETIEAEFVHRFQHIRMHIITLESDMIIMVNIIGFVGEHFHQEIIAFQRGI